MEGDQKSGFDALKRAITLPESDLTAAEAASTFFRFFRSRHVADLRLIFRVVIAVFIFHCVTIAVGALFHAHNFIDWLSDVVTYVGPAFPIYGAVVAWTYLSASSRLGIVDLFACEITTLCRVGTIFDVGERYVQMYRNPPAQDKAAAGAASFVSQEEYFPVFERNSSDLKLLEALVVTNITEFYTYMKATRDSQRRLAQAGSDPEAWRASIANVIYMLFLGYEAARKAVDDLIEFQPTQAENIIVILLTELRCYAFLIQYFKPDDLRHTRLKLRRDNYRKIVPELYRQIRLTHGSNDEYWLAAKETTSELAARYKEALSEDL